jgi:type I restriction enzyme M protein
MAIAQIKNLQRRLANLEDALAETDADALAGTGPEGSLRMYDYADLITCDKASLDIFWLKDDALEESANLPAPEVIAADITADLEAALE